MAAGPILVWLRRDLRLHDNPALLAACDEGAAVLPVFVLEDAGAPAGTAAAWWLRRSLAALQGALAARGAPLVLRHGPAADVLAVLARAVGARAVYWNRRYEPSGTAADAAVAGALRAAGIGHRVFAGDVLFPPEEWERPYKVFTPFARACRARPAPEPLPAPASLPAPERVPEGERLEDWGLEAPADAALGDGWTPGEDAARAALGRWLEDGLARYHRDRDRPDTEGTSRLSPHLAFGEISARTVWAAAAASGAAGVDAFLNELLWRDFARHLLHHFPQLPDRPLKPAFAAFPWRDDAAALAAWQEGRTGYPIVDAGMRQLRRTGWMHNRVRMIAASFLVKDLLLPWQAGAAWFAARLADADIASNAANWQWVAGCGVDAAPYFRVFNPVVQGERHDPRGRYVRQWLPELAGLPDNIIHRPWQAPEAVLAGAGVRLGRDYPPPLVDHAEARRRALAAFRGITGAGGS